MSPRYWWQDREDEDVAGVMLASDSLPLPPVPTPHAERPDLVRLGSYRAELIRKAARLPRQGARRRGVDRRLAAVTFALLRAELGR